MAGEFFNDRATLVKASVWYLHNAVPISSPLTIETPPTGSFRCKATISAVTGHATCAGTLTIGSETQTFVATGTKVFTIALTAKPVITYSGLDCMIVITAIDTGGADIHQTANTTIAVDWDDSQKWVPSPQGVWTQVDQTSCETDDFTAKIGDTVLHGGKTYPIKNIKDGEQTLSGTVLTRIYQF
jgi:hypothetical protein